MVCESGRCLAVGETRCDAIAYRLSSPRQPSETTPSQPDSYHINLISTDKPPSHGILRRRFETNACRPCLSYRPSSSPNALLTVLTFEASTRTTAILTLNSKISITYTPHSTSTKYQTTPLSPQLSYSKQHNHTQRRSSKSHRPESPCGIQHRGTKSHISYCGTTNIIGHELGAVG